MTVFKNYFKIVKKHLSIIIMYSAISIGIAIANTSYNVQESFSSSSSKVSIINHDNSALIEDFQKYIGENNQIIEVNDDKKSIQDAIFNNKVDTILVIPPSFTTDFLNKKNPQIEIKKSSQSYSETVEVLVNKYFKIADIYLASGMSEKDIINNIHNDLKKEISVQVINKKNGQDLHKLAVFYSFENYAFISIFIFIICTIMCIFNKDTIKKRNEISKMKSSKFSRELFLGHITLTLSLWLIFVLISIIIYKDLMFNLNGLLLIFNSFIFTITITSFAFLIGTLIKNQNVISGIQNVFGLGTSFISGCFISLELLDKNIVSMAKCFPSYWFIRGNYEIVKISDFTLENLLPIFRYSGIVLAFGLLFFIIRKIFLIIKLK